MPFKKTLKITSILIAFMALVLAIAIALIRWRHHAMWERELEAMAAAGYPASLADVEAMYPPIPDAQNGALFFVAAAETLPIPSNELAERLPIVGNVHVEVHQTPYSEDAMAALREYLALDDEAMPLLLEGASKAGARFHVDLNDAATGGGFLSTTGQMRALARHASVAVAVAAADGDGARIVEVVRAGLAISRALAEVPLFIPMLVAMACEGVATGELERALALGALDDNHLAQLIAALEAQPRYESNRTVLEVELYGVMRFPTLPGYTRSLGHATGESLASQYIPGVTSFEAERIAAPVMGIVYELTAMGHGVAAANAAYGRALIEGHDDMAALDTDSFFADLYTVGEYVQTDLYNPDFRIRGDAARAVLIARLQVERYRLTHGDWPGTLSDLVPDFADEIPQDPFTGAPLVYRREGAGFRLYSLGMNRVDDGGEGKGARTGDIARNVLDEAQSGDPGATE